MSAEAVKRYGPYAALMAAFLVWYIVETGAGDQEVYHSCSSDGCPIPASSVVEGQPYCFLHGALVQIVKLAANDN